MGREMLPPKTGGHAYEKKLFTEIIDGEKISGTERIDGGIQFCGFGRFINGIGRSGTRHGNFV